MTKQEFIEKHIDDNGYENYKGEALQDLESVIQEAIAEHEQKQWQKYSEKRPEKNGYYMVTTRNEEVGMAYWDRQWWMGSPKEGLQMGIKDDFITAFYELPKPYKP